MDEQWESPAKINFTLRVGAVRSDGYHPIESLVQTVDWMDEVRITETGDEDRLIVRGADIADDRSNLVWRGVDALTLPARPQLRVSLDKEIPHGAGLGGGSSNAACMIAALGDRFGVSSADQHMAAMTVGADVPFFLTGGTAMMSGVGHDLEAVDPVPGFAVAIAVPPLEISTPAVYRRWDDLGGPVGRPVPVSQLPPALRKFEMVNDLTPAAIDLEPELGDALADLIELWGRPVLMSGSGSALFACFGDVDEAYDAATVANGPVRARAVSLVQHGVRVVDR